MYRCMMCGHPIRETIQIIGIQCEKCGSKVFHKERPNMKKTLIAR